MLFLREPFKHGAENRELFFVKLRNLARRLVPVLRVRDHHEEVHEIALAYRLPRVVYAGEQRVHVRPDVERGNDRLSAGCAVHGDEIYLPGREVHYVVLVGSVGEHRRVDELLDGVEVVALHELERLVVLDALVPGAVAVYVRAAKVPARSEDRKALEAREAQELVLLAALLPVGREEGKAEGPERAFHVVVVRLYSVDYGEPPVGVVPESFFDGY